MESSHSASSGSTHQDDSWTCQRCGWVYPNAHPSAKHRRNHKKQCGKIKGFELRSEHKGGSSDEASSDDENHGKKGSVVPAVEHPSGLQSRDLPVTKVDVSDKVKLDTSIPAVENPSDRQYRETEVDVSDKVKLDTSAIPALEHPSGLQSRDLPVTEVVVSDKVKLDTSIPAVEHFSASQSRDLPVTEVDVSDTVKLDTPILEGISASLDVKPEVPAHGPTQNIIKGDAVKSDFPGCEHVPNTVSLDNTSTAFGATVVDTVEVPVLVLPRLETNEAKEFVEQDAKFEDAPIELTREIPLKTLEGHAKSGHASKIDGVEAVARDLPGLDFDLANSSQKKDAKSEGPAPEPTQSIASLDEPSRTLREQTKVSLTPCVDKVEIAAQVSGGFDSGQARESHKQSSSILKEKAANGRGSSHSSQEDDSWTCNRCGWVYPNPHPSAKHRRNHKKQCGKIKGFELRTEPHEGGSSDEVSSDGDIGVKKEHLLHQSPQILEAQDQANNPAATGSTPPAVDDPAVFSEGRISTESGSSNLQSRDLSASKGVAPIKELLVDTPNLKDISTPDIKSSDAVPELPQNIASLAEQNPPGGENQRGAAVLDQIMGLCGPDTSETKELPKLSSLKEETLSNPAIVQETLGSSELQLNAVLSLPKSVNASASEGLDDQLKDTLVERRSTNMLAEIPDGLSGDWTPKVASIPSVPDEGGSTNMLAETPDGLSGDCTSKVASIPSVPDDPGSTNMLAETPDGLSGNCMPKVASIPSVPNDHGSTSMLAEAPDGLSGVCTPKVASIPSVPDDRQSTNMLAETSDGLLENCTPKVASIPSKPDSLPSSSSPAYVENKGASILKVDEPSLAVTATDLGSAGWSNETLDASTGAGLINQSVVLMEGTDVLEKPGLDASSNFKNSDAMDYLMVHDPLRKETAEIMTGGLEGSDGLKEILLPPTDSSTEEDGRFLSAQTSLNSVEVITQNESMPEIVVRGNDDACSTGINKADEPTHSLEKQGTPVGVAHVDVSKEVTTAADTTQEAKSTQQRLDIPGYVSSKNISSDSEDFGQGVALVSAGGITEITNTDSSIAKDSYTSDKIKESETGVESSLIDSHQVKTTEAVEKPEAKEDTPCETRGLGSSDLSYTESEAGGNSSVIGGHQVKNAETSGAAEVVEKPEAKEDKPCEMRGTGSSDLSYTETNIVTRSETGVVGHLGLGASAHKLSDSLEIYEDAADSLETCSVGGSVEENEILDEPRQATDGVPEEPKHLGVASLDKRVPGGSVGLDEEPGILNGSSTGEAVPGESVGLDKEVSILNGSSAGQPESVGLDKKTSILNGLIAGEASSEEKITTLPGASYAVRSKVEDLKAPSPEAWQEPGPSHAKSEGKGKISSTSEVTEDGRSGESHTALRSLMAKEGPEKVDQIVESISSTADLKSVNKTAGSLASGNGTKPKSRSFWSHCICCPTVH